MIHIRHSGPVSSIRQKIMSNINQRKRTARVSADLFGVDSTSMQESFFQQQQQQDCQSPGPRRSPLHKQDDADEKYEFFLHCNSPASSRCSTITMDIFSTDGDESSVSSHQQNDLLRLPNFASHNRRRQDRGSASNLKETKSSLQGDEENFTYITMTSTASSYTEKLNHTPAKESTAWECSSPYTFETILSNEKSLLDANQVHLEPNLSHPMDRWRTTSSWQEESQQQTETASTTTPTSIGMMVAESLSTPYQVKSKEKCSPIDADDCFSIDLYASSPDCSDENHFSIDSYHSSSENNKPSFLELARSRRDQSLSKLQMLKKKLHGGGGGSHDVSASSPHMLSAKRSNNSNTKKHAVGRLSERLVQMEKRRQRLSHVVHSYCHAKNDTDSQKEPRTIRCRTASQHP